MRDCLFVISPAAESLEANGAEVEVRCTYTARMRRRALTEKYRQFDLVRSPFPPTEIPLPAIREDSAREDPGSRLARALEHGACGARVPDPTASSPVHAHEGDYADWTLLRDEASTLPCASPPAPP